MSKYCPLGDIFRDCYGCNCAWWDGSEGHCSMLPIRNSRSVKELEEEIEILKEENEDLKALTGLQRERKYYNKFVKEVFQKEKGSDLIYPDFDEIYKRYFELIEQREKVVEQLEELISYNKERSRMYDGHTHYDSEIMGISKAIEIVKSGGKV